MHIYIISTTRQVNVLQRAIRVLPIFITLSHAWSLVSNREARTNLLMTPRVRFYLHFPGNRH